MDYQDVLDYLKEVANLGSRLGLDTIKRLLELLNNPQDKIRFIHIGGTNGKGSTSSFLSYSLEEAGYKVGLFTSPHTRKHNESIKINQEEISDSNFIRLVEIVKDKAETMVEEGYFHPTSFEIITAISFLYFLEEKVDLVVLEVGLGGRMDSTNIIPPPLATVFTSISYDHIDILGNSLEEIAYEKSGIIKEGSSVVSYPQEEEAARVIDRVCREKNAELYQLSPDNVEIIEINNKGASFNYKYRDWTLNEVEISMLGGYQIYNAALALTTLLTLKSKAYIDISEEQIKKGFKKTKLSGRLELLREKPAFLIDGAHNLQGVEELSKAIKLFEYEKLIIAIGILEDKDTSHMVELLAPLADEIIVTQPNNPRKLDAKILAEEVRKYNKNIHIEKDIKSAIEKSLELAKEDDLILFAGSLYLIGEVSELEKLL